MVIARALVIVFSAFSFGFCGVAANTGLFWVDGFFQTVMIVSLLFSAVNLGVLFYAGKNDKIYLGAGIFTVLAAAFFILLYVVSSPKPGFAPTYLAVIFPVLMIAAMSLSITAILFSAAFQGNIMAKVGTLIFCSFALILMVSATFLQFGRIGGIIIAVGCVIVLLSSLLKKISQSKQSKAG